MRRCQIDSYKLLLEKVVSEREYKTTVYWQIYILIIMEMGKTAIAIILISIVAFLLLCGCFMYWRVSKKIDSWYLINFIMLVIAIILLS